jgi:hypothetical protein
MEDVKDLFCSRVAVIVVAREWRTVVAAIVSYNYRLAQLKIVLLLL